MVGCSFPLSSPLFPSNCLSQRLPQPHAPRCSNSQVPQAASGAHLIALCSRQDLQEFPPSKPTQVIKPCLFKFNPKNELRSSSTSQVVCFHSYTTTNLGPTSSHSHARDLPQRIINSLEDFSQASTVEVRVRRKGGARRSGGEGEPQLVCKRVSSPPLRPRAGPPMSSVRVLGTVAPHWHSSPYCILSEAMDSLTYFAHVLVL
ncbi:hypothetical protein B0H10DRAFT_2193068 [Mycena sp. CBHHK59/15]|nr:hypothetical protein B0H10DRAFT_2193068 [Mycena sp. CBHHK59/15]